MSKALRIAIDGPAGVGKTTVSRLLAKRLNLRYIDTGAMYRSVALLADGLGLDLDDASVMGEFAGQLSIEFEPGTDRVKCNGKDLTREIREPHVGSLASRISTHSGVRRALVGLQQEMAAVGQGDAGVVMEGRDVGTVVMPDADVKFFLVASLDVRAGRRHLEEGAFNDRLKATAEDMAERDRRDSTREDSPLVCAQDAVEIDTGLFDAEGVAGEMLRIITERGFCGDIDS